MAEDASYRCPPVDDRAIYDATASKYLYASLAVSVELGLFEHLAERPCAIAEIPGSLPVSRRAAEALVAVAAGLGLLRVDGSGRFGTTAAADAYLLPGSRFFRRDLARAAHADVELLRRAVRDEAHQNEPVQPLAVRMGDLPPEQVESFIEIMHGMTLPAASRLAEQPVFDGIHRLLDVAGGSGSLSLAIAARRPHVRCTILDLEPVCRIAARHARTEGVSNRINTVAADMFGDPWPTGSDAVLFGNIFHDWDWDSCVELAGRAWNALQPGGAVCLHEMLLHDRKDGPLTVALYSIAMLMHEKGKQFTANELEELLAGAGFRDFQATPTFGYYWLVTARKR